MWVILSGVYGIFSGVFHENLIPHQNFECYKMNGEIPMVYINGLTQRDTMDQTE